VALKEIDSQVDRLKAQGAKKIIVAGHSMGTPMALAYAARRDGLAGVIGLAPGHHPELMPAMYPDFFPKQLTNAKEAVAAGKGDERTAFQAAQCCTFYQTFWTTPRIYLDYFDSEGSGTMAGNAALVKEGIPVLMVYGEKDVIFKLLSDAKESYSDYVPSRLKPNPLHKRIIIDSDHRSVPERASSQVIEWLKTLP
jgi:pimeloyl-ACP methyl ester carboxylesterase